MLEQNPGFELRQERSFLDSSLPETMALARTHRRRIEPGIREIGKHWSYEDRVLVWLAGHWRNEVETFYRDLGGTIAEMFEAEQLEHLDDHYCTQLKARLG